MSDSAIVCPECRGALERRPDALTCTGCRSRFPVLAGLPEFVEPDGKYALADPIWWDRGGPTWRLPFVDVGITWFFSKHLPRNARVLDVGCGTGIRHLASIAREVHGIDRAPSRLSLAARIYREVSIASIFKIPYPDSHFDAIVSVDVLEHIPTELKDAAIAEMLRVLRPGGRMLHILDLDSDKPLHRWAKRDPVLYQKYFVDQLGHYGLEPATAAIARFERTGMRRIAVEATNRTFVQLPGNFSWQFDNEYRFRSRWVRLLCSLSWFLRRNKPLEALFSGFYQLVWTRTVERLFPIDWSFNLAVAYERPAAAPGPSS